jgi:hypothetical protein
MEIELHAEQSEQELADACEAIVDVIEHADEVELPPAAVDLLVALDDAIESRLMNGAEAA